MAKHLYSPELSSIWTSIEEYLDLEEPQHPAVLEKVIALLQERDQQLEKALLGDLVVNDVAGSVGSILPPEGQQIGWLSNFGAVDGVMDGSGSLPIVYGTPFPTDTVIVVFLPTTQGGTFLVPGSASRTGFTLNNEAPGVHLQGGYVAIGF